MSHHDSFGRKCSLKPRSHEEIPVEVQSLEKSKALDNGAGE